MRTLLRLLISSSSFSVLLLFIAVSKGIVIDSLHTSAYVSYACFCICIVMATYAICGIAARVLPNAETMRVTSLQSAESKMLPVYISLFVVGFNIAVLQAQGAWTLLALLYVFWLFLENVSYFNPFLLILGYRFYEVTAAGKVTYTVISRRRDVKRISEFSNLARLSNFIFLETSNRG